MKIQHRGQKRGIEKLEAILTICAMCLNRSDQNNNRRKMLESRCILSCTFPFEGHSKTNKGFGQMGLKSTKLNYTGVDPKYRYRLTPTIGIAIGILGIGNLGGGTCGI